MESYYALWLLSYISIFLHISSHGICSWLSRPFNSLDVSWIKELALGFFHSEPNALYATSLLPLSFYVIKKNAQAEITVSVLTSVFDDCAMSEVGSTWFA